MSSIFDEHTIFSDPKRKLTITLEDNNKKKKKLPPFTMIGRALNMKHIAGYDYSEVLLSMNKGEQWFFKLIRKHYEYKTNISIIKNNLLTPTEVKKKSIAYKSLHKKGLLKKVKQEVYMVNPDALISPDTYTINKQKWDSL